MANDQPLQVSAEDLVQKDLFELLDLQDMPEEEKTKIRVNLMETIRDRTLIRIKDFLSDEDFEEYKKMLNQPESEEADKKIDEFLASKNVDVNKLTIEETILVKQQAIQAMSGLKKEF